MREDFQHLFGIAHIFLHAKIRHPQVEVQRGRVQIGERSDGPRTVRT
jgi:hypothetical protein